MCGKDPSYPFVDRNVRGSPPRVRERRIRIAGSPLSPRITPACAGKTGNLDSPKIEGGDHPRVCGKDLVQRGKLSEHVGSPPRVRERLYLETETLYTSRITPACAGKTYFGNLEDESDRDHPRVCGKDIAAFISSVARSGSPPRVRERRTPRSAISKERGITPACAGKTEAPATVR